MPYIQIKKEAGERIHHGPLNNSLTVEELLYFLQKAIKEDPSVAKKAVLVSDDEEQNCYHGIYYRPEGEPKRIKALLEGSNWGDAEPDVYENAIIIG